jgi:hypothetical protein
LIPCQNKCNRRPAFLRSFFRERRCRCKACNDIGLCHIPSTSKALRPLPSKWHGLSDTEIRFRQRELDLVVNADARRVFEIRAKVLAALRAEMHERGFVEVETPMLHPIPGGALARPFVTHHNALDIKGRGKARTPERAARHDMRAK